MFPVLVAVLFNFIVIVGWIAERKDTAKDAFTEAANITYGEYESTMGGARGGGQDPRSNTLCVCVCVCVCDALHAHVQTQTGCCSDGNLHCYSQLLLGPSLNVAFIVSRTTVDHGLISLFSHCRLQLPTGVGVGHGDPRSAAGDHRCRSHDPLQGEGLSPVLGPGQRLGAKVEPGAGVGEGGGGTRGRGG